MLKARTVHIHDVWDGRLYQELHAMSLGLSLTTAEPGYNRLRLPDYISKYRPVVIIIATPLLGEVVAMVRQATKLPAIFVTSGRLVVEGATALLPSERVLCRESLTSLSIIGALHDCLELPTH